jgi:hypothetical protein
MAVVTPASSLLDCVSSFLSKRPGNVPDGIGEFTFSIAGKVQNNASGVSGDRVCALYGGDLRCPYAGEKGASNRTSFLIEIGAGRADDRGNCPLVGASGGAIVGDKAGGVLTLLHVLFGLVISIGAGLLRAGLRGNSSGNWPDVGAGGGYKARSTARARSSGRRGEFMKLSRSFFLKILRDVSIGAGPLVLGLTGNCPGKLSCLGAGGGSNGDELIETEMSGI